MTRIHPTAFVAPTARIGEETHIGPFSVVEADAVVGARCRLESHVVIKSGAVLGDDNYVGDGAIIGGLPQHKHLPEHPGALRIGHGNTIREHVTVHRAMAADKATLIGNANLLMVNVHVAHDCVIGDRTIFANNVMLAGHVTVDDGAYLSGAVGVHQFCRVGGLAMVGGQAHITQDVPPFVTVDGGSSRIVGLNTVGLRRAGWGREEIGSVKQAYRIIFRSGLSWTEAIERLRPLAAACPHACELMEFIAATKRGCISERRVPRAATIRLHVESETAKSELEPRRASA